MAYYVCTIAHDGDAQRQIIAHWDDDDPNRIIVTPRTVPTDELDEDRLSHELGGMGFRVVSTGSNNIGRGWAIVASLRTNLAYFNPLDRSWCAFLSDDTKRAIAARWPEARVPGVR